MSAASHCQRNSKRDKLQIPRDELLDNVAKKCDNRKNDSTKNNDPYSGMEDGKCHESPRGPSHHNHERCPSLRGGNFHSGLKDVAEDDNLDGCLESQLLFQAHDSSNKNHLSAASQRSLSGNNDSVARGSSARRPTGSGRGLIGLLNHNDRPKLARDLSSSSDRSIDSINIMDFGISQRRGCFLSAGSSSSDLSINRSESSDNNSGRNLSSLVDSDGFLGWGRKEGNADQSSLSADCKSNSRAIPMRGSLEKGNSLSHLVDAQGFLGWDNNLRKDDDSNSHNSTASIGDNSLASIEDILEDKNEEGDESVAPKDRNGSSEKRHESWRIEDYEGNSSEHYKAPPPQAAISKSGGNIIKRFTTALSSSMTPSLKDSFSSQDTSQDWKPEEIKRNTIKCVLRKGRRRSSDDDSILSSKKSDGSLRSSTQSVDASLRSSGFRGSSTVNSVFSSLRSSKRSTIQSSDLDDYSRPAIRINKEDGIEDIRELRRELCESGQNNEGIATRSWMKNGFL